MTGAMGTLGVITEVSLKCLPLPKAEATRTFELSADAAIHKVNEWGGQPLPLSATAYAKGVLHVRFPVPRPRSSRRARSWVAQRLRGDGRTPVAWNSVREQTHPHFAAARQPGSSLWRLSVRSTAPYVDFAGEQLIEWGGALRWLVGGERTDPVRIRAWAKEQGGHATLFPAPTSRRACSILCLRPCSPSTSG